MLRRRGARRFHPDDHDPDRLETPEHPHFAEWRGGLLKA